MKENCLHPNYAIGAKKKIKINMIELRLDLKIARIFNNVQVKHT